MPHTPATRDNSPPMVTLEDVTFRIRERKLLPHTNWSVRRGEQWAILGPNGSGKSTVVRTLAGELPSAAGRIERPPRERISLVSFELQQRLLSSELARDHARWYANQWDTLLTPREMLRAAAEGDHLPEHVRELVTLFSFSPLLDRPVRYLSAGELRKTLILRALSAKPTLLMLDEPFDGLDAASRDTLSGELQSLIDAGQHIMLVTHRADELVPGITHVLTLGENRVKAQGPRDRVAPAILAVGASHRASAVDGTGQGGLESPRPPVRRGQEKSAGQPLVDFRGVTVKYGQTVILSNLQWQVWPGERWGIFGPNGSGKTTILNLITGENLQTYGNPIYLFGRRRGSGESIWDVRRKIGVVTPHLQLEYRREVTGLHAVVSGLHDSIGIYRRPTREELSAAERWISLFGLSPLAERQFTRLSYGERRLFLIARAMVREPELLILDEPCQGLDTKNREHVLSALEQVCDQSDVSMLYVTHHADERPSTLTHALYLSGQAGEAVETELDPASDAASA